MMYANNYLALNIHSIENKNNKMGSWYYGWVMKVHYNGMSIAIVIYRLRSYWINNLVLKIQRKLCSNFSKICIKKLVIVNIYI
jgi:hypothetical protein